MWLPLWTIKCNRRIFWPVLSSAARMPLPGATMACAVLRSSSCFSLLRYAGKRDMTVVYHRCFYGPNIPVQQMGIRINHIQNCWNLLNPKVLATSTTEIKQKRTILFAPQTKKTKTAITSYKNAEIRRNILQISWSSIVNPWSVCLSRKSAFVGNVVGDLDLWSHDPENICVMCVFKFFLWTCCQRLELLAWWCLFRLFLSV